jgi:hypothetical protein
MNDVKDLLERALDDTPEPLVDPAADLARGRTRLRRRRGTILGGAAATVLVLGAVPLALGAGAGAGGSAPTVASASTAKTLTSIGLVSYTGKQPRGYTVAWVPDGWVIQGGDLAALTIAPKGGVTQAQANKDLGGSKDKRKILAQKGKVVKSSPDDYSSFVGKLVVMSASEDEKHDLGTAVTVDGRAGYLRPTNGIQILSYKSATGRWVDIQVPGALGWKQAEIVKFAAGITVSKDAENTFG